MNRNETINEFKKCGIDIVSFWEMGFDLSANNEGFSLIRIK